MMAGVKRKLRCGGKAMTAVVLAGGRGRRMKADKAGLDVGGRTLLEHVLAQVEPYFDEVLISLSPGQAAPPLPAASRARVVRDERPGLGPIGGLLACLKAARNDACAVVACDIPEIDVPFLHDLAKGAADADIAVPVGPAGLHEPLFAVYRRSIIPAVEALLENGERSLLPLYAMCRTVQVGFDDPRRIRNLNTRRDYEDFLRTRPEKRPASRVAKKPDRRRGR
jgi:molybdopterin-guanine dinucleotide biosynthesis protein A